MNKITLLVSTLFVFSISVSIAQENFQLKSRPTSFESVGVIGDSIFNMKMPVSYEAKNAVITNKLPYPIIFIHGLNSSSETWNTTSNYLDSQYGFTFGGRFDFCLNADNNDAQANTNFYPTSGADIAAFETTVMQNGDYYYVNYDVDPDGSIGSSVYSNQSAIVKQGAAVKRAVERVLELTGKDKVILVGHSMGGLASREYIQNSYNWQTDGQHHVAKFLTLGTPHGGSNASDIGLGWIIGMETHSEALRDLKTTYYYSGDQGRYLFGGQELNNSNNMNEHLFGQDYWNIDINCNGTIGDNIVGLNQKTIDNLIDFTNVIGKVNGDTTDGVVTEPSAKMNNYLTNLQFPAKYFYYTAIGVEVHTALTGRLYQIMQGLDEPNFKELAFGIDINTIYNGFTTVQENSADGDDDYFKFTVTDNIIATLDMSAIATSQMQASFLDSAGNLIGSIQNNSGATLSNTVTLAPGDYFLKLRSTTPTSTDYETPYQFVINTVLSTNSNAFENFSYYPNPVKNTITFDNIALSQIKIYNTLGQLVAVKNLNINNTQNQIDVSNLTKGVYLFVLEDDSSQKTIQIIKE